MNRHLVKNIAIDHYKELQKKFKHIIPGFDTEKIHLFRVEYKKLRAFLRMISKRDEKQGKLIFTAGLKKVYKISGAIRDLQLQQQRVLDATKMDIRKPKEYFSILQKRIDKLKTRLSETFLKNPIAKSKKKTIASLPGEFTLVKIKEFIEEKQAVINAIILSKNFSDKNIHSIRKNLKDLLYNLKMVEAGENEYLEMNIWIEKNEKYLNDLAEDLGTFQDSCTAITLLKRTWLHKLNKSEQELLARIKDNWLAEKSTIKQLLIKKMTTAIGSN